MENIYKEILNLALSGKDIEEKVSEINSKWALINEQKLFKYAEIDEVASHIAFILKQTDIKFDSIWEEEYKKIDDRI
jgi:hypothetical protein